MLERMYHQRAELTVLIESFRKEISELCIHDETVQENITYEGNYYDRTEYVTRTRCKTCDEILHTKSSYGSYS